MSARDAEPVELVRCAFCHRLDAIYRQGLSDVDTDAAVDALFDLSNRCRLVRRAYGRRHGYHRRRGGYSQASPSRSRSSPAR